MTAVYGWVGDILSFLVLVNLVEILLPSGKYGKYIRFFSGILLVLVTVRPFLSPLRIDGTIADHFEEYQIRAESGELREKIQGIEAQQAARLIDSCEAGAAAEVEGMIREAGLEPVKAEVRIGRIPEQEDYGKVTCVTAVVKSDNGSSEYRVTGAETALSDHTDTESADNEVRPVQVQPVVIQVDLSDSSSTGLEGGPGSESGSNSGAGSGNVSGSESGSNSSAGSGSTLGSESGGSSSTSSGSSSGSESGSLSDAAAGKVADLRRKVEAYYDLESENVDIQMDER